MMALGAVSFSSVLCRTKGWRLISVVPDQRMAARGNTATQNREATRISNGSRQKALNPTCQCEDEHASVAGGFGFDLTIKRSVD
jgi:hypothetical protein